MKRILAALLLMSTPALAWERDPGGYIDNYAAQIASYRAAGATKVLDGWYYSAASLWLGYEQACIAPGSDTVAILHPVTDRTTGRRAVTPDSPWNYIVGPENYRRIISRTPWGARLYATASARGCFSSPAPCNFYAAELIAMGTPVCR